MGSSKTYLAQEKVFRLWVRPFPKWIFLPVLLALSAPALSQAAESYSVSQVGSATGGGSYSLASNPNGIGITFYVTAMNGGSADGTYTGPATVSFLSTFAPQTITDPIALIENNVPIDASASTGTAVINFSSGLATIGVLLRTPVTTEQMLIQDGAKPVSAIYPAGVWNFGSKFFQVAGYPTNYYLEAAGMATTTATYYSGTTYVGQTDNLILSPAALENQASDVGVTIPYSASVTDAAAFAVTGINGGYAQASTPFSPNLYFQRPAGSSTSPVSIWYIVDYGNAPGGPLTDYSNPTTYQTVYETALADVGVYPNWNYVATSQPLTLLPSGPVTYAALGSQPFMNNGQVIVRVWAANAGTTVLMRYETSTSNAVSLSSVSVPYSNKNTQPVKGSLLSGDYLNNAPVTLNYVIDNASFPNINFIRFDIPADSAAAAPWTIASYPTSVAGYPGSAVSVVSPGVGSSTPGGVTITFPGSDPMSIASSVTLTLIGTSDSASTVLSFGNMAVSAASGSSTIVEPSDASSAVVTTLGAPSTPKSFAASPFNYASTGNQMSLSWAPVTDNSPLGYAISRSPVGGAFTGPVTLPSGVIVSNAVTVAPSGTVTYLDTNAPDLAGYTYTIQAYNAVAQSATTSVGPVTTFANPNAPSPVTALTGGSTVQLSWAAPASASGSYAVTGYQVWRDTQPSMATKVDIATVASGPYTDASASATQFYYYGIASLDSQYSSGAPGTVHISGLSSPVTGFPPGNPPALTAVNLTSSSPANLQVIWTAPTGNLTAPTQYFIYRGTNAAPSLASPYTVVSASPVTFNDNTVAAGNFYVYQVASDDGAGVTTNPSNAVTGLVGPAPPGTPTPNPSTSAVTLVWPAVTPSTGETVVSYVVYQDSVSVANPVTTAGASQTFAVPATTAHVGTDYNYQVAAMDQNSIVGGLSAGVSSALLPPAPASLGASLILSNDNVAVTWVTPVPTETNLGGYSLTHAIGTATPTVIATPGAGAVSYLDASITSADAGLTITYNLTAQNDLNGIGPSSVSTVIVPPVAPSGLAANASSSAVTLSWGAIVGQGVTGYTVYRTNLPSGTPTVIATPSSASITDTSGLTAGTNYAYYVTASNGGGAGLGSTPVTTALLLPAPASLTASVSETGTQFAVTLTWTAPSANGNMTGYNLIRNNIPSTSGGAVTNLLSNAATSTTNYLDAPVTSSAGTTFYYFVQGLDLGGAGATSMVGLQMPPIPPVQSPATSSASAITVNWTAITGENVNQYTIYRSQLPSGTPTVVATATPGTANSYTDASGSLSQGTSYVYYVTASNPGGGPLYPGGMSPPSNSVTAGLAPPLPGGLKVSSISASNTIGVTWSSVTAQDSNATAVSLYVHASSAVTTGAAITQITPANTVTFSDNGVYTASVTGESPDTTYYYWLQTVNPFGFSALAGPVSKLTYPAAVTISSAALDSDGVSRDLSWVTIGSPDVTSYNIYREQVGSSSGFVSVGTVSATGLSFPVKRTNTITSGAQYLYEITAVNATGEGISANQVTIGIPPTTPVSVTAASGVSVAAAVSLTWTEQNTSAQSVTGYAIYRNTSATLSTATTVATGISLTNYLDVSINPAGGTTYYYWIQAFSSATPLGSPLTLTTSSVTVLAYALPNPPTISSESDGSASATLTWTAPAITTYPISGYTVYESANGGATVKANATPVAGSPLTLTGLSNGTTYTLWAQAVDSKGNLSAYSTPINAYPATSPGLPGSVAPASGKSAVEVTWSPSTAGSYPVSYYNVEEIALSGPTTTFHQVTGGMDGYVDSGASSGATYVFNVEAVDASGVTTGVHISGYAGPATAIEGLITVNPPSNVTAQGGVNQVAVSWVDPVVGAPTAYQLFRFEVQPTSTSPATLNPAPSPGGSPYTDSTAVNNATYGYYFLGNSSGVTSAASATVFATAAAPPTPPTPVIPTDGNASVTLNWTASPAEGAVTISQYNLIRTINGGPPTTLSTSGPAITYLDNSGALNNTGQTVVYTIQAVNSNGTTGVVSSTVTGYPYAPFTPTGFGSTDSSTAVTLNWTAPSLPSWTVTQYTVTRTALTGGAVTTFTTPSLTYTDAAVTLDQLYAYTLTATDNKGHISTLAGPVTDGPVSQIAAPTSVIATAGSQQVLFDWPASAPVTGSLPVSEYQVTLSTSGGPTVFMTTQSWYLDSGIPNGAAVSATIQAVDATGNPVGNHISIAVTGGPVTPLAADLNPPTGLSVTATGPNSNALTWTMPNVEGLQINYYNLYRSSSFNGPFTNPVSIGYSALSPVTTYNDTTVSPSTTYYYVLTAVYQQGGSQVESPNSNHASDTTPAPVKPASPVTTGQMGFDANLLKPTTGQVLTIYFEAPQGGAAEFDVYNVAGNLVRELFATAQANVQQTVTWDGKDRNGSTVASGIYLIELKGPGIHVVRKVLVVK